MGAELYKTREIMAHISRLFTHYGETDSYFDEYVNTVLKFDLDRALDCFRDLIRQLEWMKPQGNANERREQGMPDKSTFQKKSYQLQPAFRDRP